MIFTSLKLKGAFLIDLEPIEDSRGFFSRSWCDEEYRKIGVEFKINQCSVSFNKNKGTLRGLHYQIEPFPEAKVVRCTSGSIFDVVVDIRPESDTFLQWEAFELSQKNKRSVYVPPGFAHGFQSNENDSEVFYMVSESFKIEYSRTILWNDPSIGIMWPNCESRTISSKDASAQALVL